MKIYLFFTVSMFFINCNGGSTKNITNVKLVEDSSTVLKIKSIDHKYYKNKQLIDYLKVKQIAKYSEFTVVDEPPGKVSSIILKYDSDISIEVFLSMPFEYTGEFSNTKYFLKKLDHALISSIVIYIGDEILMKV